MASEYLCGTLSEYLNTRGIFKNFQLEIVDFSVFGNAGETAQGFAGKVVLTNRAGINVTAVFKVGRADDWTITLENIISQDLCEILPYCPWFTCGYGMERLLITKYDRDFRRFLYGFKGGDPFRENRNTEGLVGLYKDVMFMQQAVGTLAWNFYETLDSHDDESTHKLFACAMQLLAGLEIAQTTKGFSHNDLHPLNYIIVPIRATEELILTRSRRVGETAETWRLTPSYGLIPMVIDYGFSYSTACDDKPWYGSPENEAVETAGDYSLGPNPICDLYKVVNGFGMQASRMVPLGTEAGRQRAMLVGMLNGARGNGLGENGHFTELESTPSVMITNLLREGLPEGSGVKVPEELNLIKVLVKFPTVETVPVPPFPLSELQAIIDTFKNLYRTTRSREIAANIFKQLFEAAADENPTEYISTIYGSTAGGIPLGRLLDGIDEFARRSRIVAEWISAVLPPLITRKKEFYSYLQATGAPELRTVSTALDHLQRAVNIPDRITRINVFDSVAQKAETFEIGPNELQGLISAANPVDFAVLLYRVAQAARNTSTCGSDNGVNIANAVAMNPDCGWNDSDKVECQFAPPDSP